MLLLVTTDWPTISSVVRSALPYERFASTREAAVFLASPAAGDRYAWTPAYGPDVITDPDQHHLARAQRGVGIVAHTPGSLDRALWAGTFRLDLETVVALPDGEDFLRTRVRRHWDAFGPLELAA